MNPNANRISVDSADLANKNVFPLFVKALHFIQFRGVKDLEVKFRHPISVISGENRSGKTSILMALACSHENFKKRQVNSGILSRQTWSSLMKFSPHDVQTSDWEYTITYKEGDRTETRRGQRKSKTKKWNGLGKKEGQIKKREVVFIDLDRLLPARSFSPVAYANTKKSKITGPQVKDPERLNEYMSYIFETESTVSKCADYLDRDVFKYKTNAQKYSSYNAASGEDTLIHLLTDIINAESKALILIDEIESGLHPKVQRRLANVLYDISKKDQKQFIITTHSPTFISCFSSKSRIFIEKTSRGNTRAIYDVSATTCMTKMDSVGHPLVEVFCEDRCAAKIIKKALIDISSKHSSFSRLIEVVPIGAANETFQCYAMHLLAYNKKEHNTRGYACILDGDMKGKHDKKGVLLYPPQECLYFLGSAVAIEKALLTSYLDKHPCSKLEYYIHHTNPHCLFQKAVEKEIFSSEEEGFQKCWETYLLAVEGKIAFLNLKKFLTRVAKKFSKDL